MRIIKYLLFLLVLGNSIHLHARDELDNPKVGDSIRFDQESREYLVLSDEKLQSYKEDEDLQFRVTLSSGNNWLAMFLSWLFRQFNIKSPISPGLIKVLEIIFYVFIAGVLIYFILKLLGIKPGGLFYGGGQKTKDPYEVTPENLEEIDFNAEIQKAAGNREYRKAIRLLYLFSLKLLAMEQLVEIRTGKTNHDYLYEIKSQGIRKPFSELGYVFEFTWYGNFEADKSVFQVSETAFNQFRQELEKE